MPDLARWATVETVFLGALDLPEPERPAFLDRACGGDGELRALVERLVADVEGDAFFFDRDAAAVAASVFAAADDDDADVEGRQVGPYRLVRLLGRGGMGTVYLAEREGDGFRQRVALKLLPHFLPAGDLLHRFRRERALLASLDHPGVARFIDGGRTEDGAPYYVMEYVDGEPITAYCDRRGLSLAARLALFEQVCDVVQHAHQRLIVHRDLKPGNIFVTEAGGQAQVKLLDFGVAKLIDPASAGMLDAEQAAEAMPLTRDGALPLTPRYAAPEQLRREAVTTAADVYALGVLLYELIAGRHPHPALPFLAPAALEAEPPRPAAALAEATKDPAAAAALHARYGTSPDRLRRAVAGDLDVVCLKALRPDPARRYASAAQLGDDVRACRAGYPVSARPESIGYRLRRFAGRHRAGVATAALVGLLAIGFAVLYTHRITAERNRVREEAQKAAALNAYLVSLFESSDPHLHASRDSMYVRDLLDDGAARLRAMLDDQPGLKADMLETLGGVYTSLNLFDQADSLLQEALALRQGARGEAPAALVETLGKLGYLRAEQTRFAEARTYFEQALDLERRTTNEQARVVSLRHRLAASYSGENRFDLAWLHYEQLIHPDVLQAVDPAQRARVLTAAANTARQLNNLAGTEQLYTRALDAARSVPGAELLVARVERELAGFYFVNGAYDEARSHYEPVLATLHRYREEQAEVYFYTLIDLGMLEVRTGRPSRADTLLAEGREEAARLFGTDHRITADATRFYANAVESSADHARAAGLYRQAVAAYRAIGWAETAQAYDAELGLVRTLLAAGRLADADAVLRRLARRFGQSPLRASGYASVVAGWLDLHRARVGLAAGRFDEAERLARSARAALRETPSFDPDLLAYTDGVVGAALSGQGRHDRAEPLLLQSAAALDSLASMPHLRADVRAWLAGLYTARGMPAEAARYGTE